MNSSKDLSSFSIYPKTRSDLIIVSQTVRGIQTYMIKDPVTRVYRRIGEIEYTIMTLLDGNKAFHQIQEEFEEKSGGMILESKDLENFLKYLKDEDLLERPKTEKSILFYQKMKDKRKRKLRGRLGLKNILELTFPAFDPDKLFDKIIHPLSFFWSKGFLIFSFFCIFLVALIAFSDWEAFINATFGIYSFQGKGVFDFVLIYVLFFFIVGIHECAHGLTCKYYGGEVHELGFVLYYFQPCFYCLVDDAYLFQNKYKRMTVMIAGPYSEVVLCTFAVFLWWLTPPHIFLNKVAAYLLSLTGLVAIVFNFNPLMKYDGYYILSDHLEILNLRERSFAYVSSWLKKNVLKMEGEPPEDVTPGVKRAFVIYGLLAILYSAFVIAIMFSIAKNFLVGHYHIWGILILLLLVYLILRKKVKRLWIILKEFEQNRKLFLYVRNHPLPVLLIFLVLFYGLFIFKVNWQVEKDFVVAPKTKVEVRSLNQGFVQEILVKEGDKVFKNQLLVVLKNDSLQCRVANLNNELSLLSQKIRENYLTSNAQMVKSNLDEKKRLEFELKEAEKRLEQMKICAPVNSWVLTPRIEEKMGVFIDAGEAVCELADLSQLQAIIHLLQWEVGDVKKNYNVELKIFSFSKSFEGIIKEISFIPSESGFSFYEARVQIENFKEMLKPGMTGKARIECGKVSLVGCLYKKIFRSIRTELWK